MGFISLLLFFFKIAGISSLVTLGKIIIRVLATLILPNQKHFFSMSQTSTSLRMITGFIESVTVGCLLYIGLPLTAIIFITLLSTYALRAIQIFWFLK